MVIRECNVIDDSDEVVTAAGYKEYEDAVEKMPPKSDKKQDKVNIIKIKPRRLRNLDKKANMTNYTSPNNNTKDLSLLVGKINRQQENLFKKQSNIANN